MTTGLTVVLLVRLRGSSLMMMMTGFVAGPPVSALRGQQAFLDAALRRAFCSSKDTDRAQQGDRSGDACKHSSVLYHNLLVQAWPKQFRSTPPLTYGGSGICKSRHTRDAEKLSGGKHNDEPSSIPSMCGPRISSREPVSGLLCGANLGGSII